MMQATQRTSLMDIITKEEIIIVDNYFDNGEAVYKERTVCPLCINSCTQCFQEMCRAQIQLRSILEMAMSGGGSSTMMRNAYTGQMGNTSQSGQGIQSGSNEPSQQAQQPQKNTAFLCKAGCETVQEIVVRTCEVFSQLKAMPLPSGTAQGSQISMEKKMRIQEFLSTIQRQFKTLRAIYTRVNDDCAGMEYTHIESLIPYKDEGDSKSDQKKISDNYRPMVDEARDLREQLYLKARYMKEIIEQLRKIIWEVNTMLAMSNT